MKTFKFTNIKNGKETRLNGDKCSRIGTYYKVFVFGRKEEVGSFYMDSYLMEELPYDPSSDTVEYFDFGPMNLYFDPEPEIIPDDNL